MERIEYITEHLGRIAAVESIVVYGADEANLLIVMRDLEPATLRALAAPVQWWVEKTGGWPRMLTAALIRDSLDVFPIEMLELSQRRRVLHGSDLFIDVRIDPAALRHQCERELREKMMRLREAYLEHHTGRALRGMMAASLTTFARIFRACLVLLDVAPPVADRDVIAALCERLDLDPEPFFAVSRGDSGSFDAYYRVLSATEARIDRLVIKKPEKETVV
jgi:hypothetical protein